ncbi:MAG: hypothetical protein PH343_05135 [Nitrospira sp.]|nr:hypothetical protein [Nitrospira sp.]
MRKNTYILFFVTMVLSLIWTVNSQALERRVGSLEFSYTGPTAPIGMVMLNHLDTQRPSIEYEFPGTNGGFTTPWGILIDRRVVVGDTLIMATNPYPTPITIGVILYDKDGLTGPTCTKNLVLGAKKTVLLATRTWMSTCPVVIP